MKVSSHLFSLSISLSCSNQEFLKRLKPQIHNLCLSPSYFILLLFADIITCNFIETTTKISLLTFVEFYIFSSGSIVEVLKLSNSLSSFSFYAPKSIFFCPFKFIVCCEFSCTFCNCLLTYVFQNFPIPGKLPGQSINEFCVPFFLFIWLYFEFGLKLRWDWVWFVVSLVEFKLVK